jgi:hypothetical protein
VLGIRKAAQIAAHLRDHRHRCYRLHTGMCLQELHYCLIWRHLSCDLLQDLLHGGLHKLKMSEDMLQ